MPAKSKKNKDSKDTKDIKSKIDRSISMFFDKKIKKVTRESKLKISTPFIDKKPPNIKDEYIEARSMARFEKLMGNVSVSSKVKSSVAKSLTFDSDSDSDGGKKMKLPDAKKGRTTLPDLSFFSSSSSSDSEEEIDEKSVTKVGNNKSISYKCS